MVQVLRFTLGIKVFLPEVNPELQFSFFCTKIFMDLHFGHKIFLDHHFFHPTKILHVIFFGMTFLWHKTWLISNVSKPIWIVATNRLHPPPSFGRLRSQNLLIWSSFNLHTILIWPTPLGFRVWHSQLSLFSPILSCRVSRHVFDSAASYFTVVLHRHASCILHSPS